MATATQTDLFLAILALDAYNRGYNPGMTFAGDSDSPGTEIGDATILQATDDLSSQNSSFYAVAYSWNSETVISYRGTTFENNAANLGDVLNGWTLSLGFPKHRKLSRRCAFTPIRRSTFPALSEDPFAAEARCGDLALESKILDVWIPPPGREDVCSVNFPSRFLHGHDEKRKK